MAVDALEQRLSAVLSDPKVPQATREAVRGYLRSTSVDQALLMDFAARAMAVARAAKTDPQAKATFGWMLELVQLAGLSAPTPVAAPAPKAAPKTAPKSARSRACFSPGETCLDAIIRCFRDVERTADVCVFTITDDRIRQSMEGAHRRGVKVRVISDNDKAGDEGSDLDALTRAGVEVRVDETEAHMHHKFAVFDRELLLTGSYNWTRSAARFNQENLIVTDDATLITEFGDEFDRLWSQFR